MTCREIEQYLEECVERRIAPDEQRLLPHLDACADCRDAWESFLVLQTAVGHLAEFAQVPDLTEKVLARWRPAHATNGLGSRSTARRVARIALAVVAVGILLAFVLPGVLGLFQGDALVTDVTPDGTQPVRVDHDSPAAPPVRLDTILADTNVALKTVWGETGGAFVQLNPWIPERTAPEPENPEDPGNDESLTTHLRRDLQPLGRQFRDSIGFLIRTSAVPRTP